MLRIYHYPFAFGSLRRLATAICLLCICAFESPAIPASQEVFVATQPDGTTLLVRLHGDEFFHYTTTADGLVIIENETDGFYYYARNDASGRPGPSSVRAADTDRRTETEREYIRTLDNESVIRAIKRSAEDSAATDTHGLRKGPGLFVDATFPTTGKQKAIVILVEYTDVKFRVSDPHDYFSRLLNEEGFSDYEATGSARDYYLKSSEGKFDIDFDVYGPVTLPHAQAYYGSNGMGGRDGVNASMMVVDACDILDKEVDFTLYDRDNDGVIDNVFLFYAGQGEDSGGGSDAVWPHSADAPRGHAYDGKHLQSYGCTNEWVPRPGGARPDGIGAFCHEFGHVLGLPDLYKTANTGSEPFTPGGWSLMDRGAHNNERRTPPALDLFSRNALGWWEPRLLESPATCILNPLTTAGEGYMIPGNGSNDFYLIENRQRTGWDAYVPGHGLLVWHVDYDPEVWARFAVNNDAAHQHVDIIEADGIQTEDTRPGDTFPGSANVTSLTPALYPQLASENSLTEIRENPDGTIIFKFRGGSPAPEPVSLLPASGITPRSFTARWNASAEATDYRLRVFYRANDGVETPVSGYDGRLTGPRAEIDVEDLEPETEYHYTVSVVKGATESAPSDMAVATTLALTHEYVIPVACEAADITDSSLTASWLPVEGAESYTICVSKVELDGVTALSESFDDKIATWNTNSDRFYANASYAGAKSPSLRLTDGGYVCTPLLERGSARSFSFWHRANSADLATIHVEAYAHGCWNPVSQIEPVSAKGGFTSAIRDFPAETDAVRVILSDPSGSASIYVDDFTLVTSAGMTLSALPDYTDINVGSGFSFAVKGLEPDTEYLYIVRAVKDNKPSMASAPVYARTLQPAGVEKVSPDRPGSCFRISGMEMTVSTSPGNPVTVYDLRGIAVRALRADDSGNATLALPGKGIYVVKSGPDTFKAVVR